MTSDDDHTEVKIKCPFCEKETILSDETFDKYVTIKGHIIRKTCKCDHIKFILKDYTLKKDTPQLTEKECTFEIENDKVKLVTLNEYCRKEMIHGSLPGKQTLYLKTVLYEQDNKTVPDKNEDTSIWNLEGYQPLMTQLCVAALAISFIIILNHVVVTFDQQISLLFQSEDIKCTSSYDCRFYEKNTMCGQNNICITNDEYITQLVDKAIDMKLDTFKAIYIDLPLRIFKYSLSICIPTVAGAIALSITIGMVQKLISRLLIFTF